MIILCYGLPGTGKTTLMHDLVSAMSQTHRFFVVDKANEWLDGAFHWREAKNLPITVLWERNQLPKIEEMPETGIFVFPTTTWDALEVGQLVVSYGNTCYVHDEIDSIAGKEGWKESPLRGIVHEGRHQRNALGEICVNHIMGACRRPQSLHTDLTDIYDQIYLFRVKGSNTKKRLLNDSVIEDETEWEHVRNLENFQCKHLPSDKFFAIQPLGTGKPNQQMGRLPERKTE